MTKKQRTISLFSTKLIYQIQPHGSVTESDPCRIQITPQNNSLKTKITPKLASAIRYLIYKHTTFLRHKVMHALPNVTVV